MTQQSPPQPIQNLLRGHMEAGSEILERTWFILFIRDAIVAGTSVDVATGKLNNAGVGEDFAKTWIKRESTAQRDNDRARIGGVT